MRQVAKIVLKVLAIILKIIAVETVGKAQFRSRKGLGTRKATFMLRTAIERAVEM